MFALLVVLFASATLSRGCIPSHPVVNWDSWLGSQAGQPSTVWAGVDVSWNTAQSTMDISVTVPYIGQSTAQGGKTRGFLYKIDFESFPSNGRSISDTNSCENRESASFVGKSFPDWWTYTQDPWAPGQVGNASTNMEYGPSNGWTQAVTVPSNVNNITSPCECVNVSFTRSFTLAELGECTIHRPATNNKAFTWVEDNVAVNFTGTLHVTAVSNFFSNGDLEYYAKSIAAVPIRITYNKALHVVGTANVRNYGVMAQGAQFDSVTNTIVISLITWNPFFVRFDIAGATLLSPSPVNFPFIDGLHSISETTPYIHGTGTYNDCMFTSPLRCFQRTVIRLNVSNSCPIGENRVLTDQYRLDMSLHCNSSEISAADTARCNNYLAAGNTNHMLVQGLNFVLPCDGVDLSGAISGQLRFYETPSYSNVFTTTPEFVAEDDTAFVEIALSGSTPSTFQILEVRLLSVYICTVSSGDMSGMDPVTGDGGCIQNQFVENGPNDAFYALFLNGLPNNNLPFAVAVVNSGGVDKVRFRFQVPTMNRPVFYVHAQVQVSVLNSTSPIRRRVLLSSGGAGSGATAFNNAQVQAKTRQRPSVTSNAPKTPATEVTTIVIIVMAVVIFVLLVGGLWCWNAKRKADETERETAENTLSQGTEFQIKIGGKSPGARHKAKHGVSVESTTTTPLRSEDHEDDLIGSAPATGPVFGVSGMPRVV